MKNSSKTLDLNSTISTCVVAVGASAGGLEAINEFFENVPEGSGLAYIVIQHLSPDYKSMMAELLSKHTTMHVYEASEEMLVEPNCIYLIPSRKILTIQGGKLKLQEKIRNQQPNNAIDIFFESI